MLDVLDASEFLEMKSYKKILAKVSVQLAGYEIVRATFPGLYAVYNKIQIIRKSLDFGLITSFNTIFDGKVMKTEDIS